MSLTQALLSSATGLRATQAGLALISANVANAETPGYIRKTLTQVATSATGVGAGVRTIAVNRELDQYVQRQLRIETAGGNYADVRARFYDRLQLLFGQPGADGTLEATFNDFTAALDALTTSPDAYSARTGVLNAAQALSQQLNTMTADVQNLRSDAEYGLADAVQRANNAMAEIARLNIQLGSSPGSETATAVLMDQRDNYIDQLSELMDIRVINTGANQLSVFTVSGVQLVGSTASRLAFDPQDLMTAASLWNADPNKRSAGTITLISPNGDGMDLLANGSIRSGQIAALAEMRDQVLVQTQNQLDALAAVMAQALSDRTTAGTAASAPGQNGFQVDLNGLLAGNSVRVAYTEVPGGAQRTVTFVRVDDPSVLPLSNDATVDPSDRVVGINFAGGMGSVATQIAGALGAGFTVSNPTGTILRVLDDGGASVTMGAMSATRTTTALAGDGVELPLFVDGTSPYSGAVTGAGSQWVGLAGRLAVNGALLGDPAKLVAYSTGTAAGDTTRPNFLLAQLSQATLRFQPQSGIGSVGSPFEGALPTFLHQVITRQGDAAAAASNLQQGQAVVVNALRQRATDASGVNIDQEMTHLLQLQNAYGANARVLTAVKEMMDLLLRM